MKKLLCILCTFAMLLSMAIGAHALNYYQCDENPSTFETFEEASANGPVFLKGLFGGEYCNDPALEGYPEGTTYIYRSADRWSSSSAGYRKNTVISVYTDVHFESKEDAQAYLQDLGLIDIIEECKGSIILVTPIGDAYGDADQYAYYRMQTATCNLGGAVTIDGARYTSAEGAYYGGTTFRYLIGIGDGATFINNYIASTFDYITRIAGQLLIGGHIDRIRDVAGVVPTYLVNCTPRVLEKYQAANDTDACGYIGDVNYYFNQALPLQIVYDAQVEDPDLAACVKDAYYNMFIKAERVPVVKAGLHTASTLYAGENWNQAPYSLSERNAFFGYKTADGLVVEEFKDSERFADYKVPEENVGFASSAGEYIDVWYEVMPEEVIDGTAPEHSIPLFLALHGGGDDPLQFLDEMNFFVLAGKERFGIIAPFHSGMFSVGQDIFPPVVDYILEKYPALDPSRVYVTGYSMGGGATLHAINGNAGKFAAAVPNAAAIFVNPDEEVNKDDVDMPIMFTTATYDFCGFGGMNFGLDAGAPYEPEHIHPVYQMRINDYLELNGMDTIEYDFDTYEMSGFKADSYVEKTLNNEYRNYTWYLNNDKGIPMVALNVTDFLPHGLYPEFGKIIWDFCKHYSRNIETGEVIYNPYVN